MSADYCTPIAGGVVCGTRMVESSRTTEGVRWCFTCRRRVEFVRIVMVPDGLSYYGPTVDIRCGECSSIDGDLFPGRCREWDE